VTGAAMSGVVASEGGRRTQSSIPVLHSGSHFRHGEDLIKNSFLGFVRARSRECVKSLCDAISLGFFNIFQIVIFGIW